MNCVNIHASLSGNLVSFTCIPVLMTHLELFPSHGCQVQQRNSLTIINLITRPRKPFKYYQTIPRRILGNSQRHLNIAIISILYAVLL